LSALGLLVASAVSAAVVGLCTAADSQPEQRKSRQDGFVGQYVGSLQPTGEYVRDAETGEKQFKEQKCGSCHIDASVERAGDGYRLTMLVDHGKDKQGNPRIDKFVLEGIAKEGTVRFAKAPWTITLSRGEATGKYAGRMVGDVKMKLKTDAPSGGSAPKDPKDSYR
jgi:hypothetical protein